MEELETCIALNFRVTSDINCPTAIHPRFNSYKNNSKSTENQEERRMRVIETSKARREELVNQIRKITRQEEPMDEEATNKRRPRKFGDHLMLSEWLVDIPEDLEENYSIVVCYVGKRCLIVASRGSTVCYDKSGSVVSEFTSALSGGNMDTVQKSTILDCIYDPATRTYHIIDMLSHDTLVLSDCETEFRWYWMERMFQENMANAHLKSEDNPFTFVFAPRVACTRELLEEVFSNESEVEVDGILFYNKKCPYVCGFSPVTTWLKPYMLPEILGLNIHESYLKGMPSWYKGYADHVEQVKKKAEARAQRRLERKAKEAEKIMDHEESETHIETCVDNI